MTTYTTIHAELEFKDQASMDKVLVSMRKGGWLTKDNHLMCEPGDLVQDTPVVNGLRLSIPYSSYPNLQRIFDSGCLDSVVGGFYNAHCNDGGNWMACSEFGIDLHGNPCRTSHFTKDFSFELDEDDEIFEKVKLSRHEKEALTLDEEEWEEAHPALVAKSVCYYEVRDGAIDKVFDAMSVEE